MGKICNHCPPIFLGNSVNNDQTAPPGIVWSVYALYFIPLLAFANRQFLHPLSANLLGSSINNDQTAPPGIVWSVYVLYFMPLFTRTNGQFLHPLSANLGGNSVNNDQTAPPGVVWSVCALFVHATICSYKLAIPASTVRQSSVSPVC